MLETYFLSIALLVGVGALVSSTEYLSNWRQYRETGIFSWAVLGAGRQPSGPAMNHLIGVILGYPVILLVLWLYVAGTILLLISAACGSLSLSALLIVASALLVINYRNQLGLEGSDQMILIIIVALLLHSAAQQSRLVAVSCLWFIALQSCLSYFAAGIAKLASPLWRNGQALLDVMNTATYGREPISRLLHRIPFLSKVLCWNVIVFHSLFPLALLLGEPTGLVFLAWGALFHVTSALVMGLNRFVWAFLASYPAILFCMRRIEPLWP